MAHNDATMACSPALVVSMGFPVAGPDALLSEIAPHIPWLTVQGGESFRHCSRCWWPSWPPSNTTNGALLCTLGKSSASVSAASPSLLHPGPPPGGGAISSNTAEGELVLRELAEALPHLGLLHIEGEHVSSSMEQQPASGQNVEPSSPTVLVETITYYQEMFSGILDREAREDRVYIVAVFSLVSDASDEEPYCALPHCRLLLTCSNVVLPKPPWSKCCLWPRALRRQS